MIEKLKEIVGKYSHKTFYQMGDFSQFTIDTIEYFEEQVDRDELHEEPEKLGSVQDLIGSISYDTGNILEIIKEGKDKELFKELSEDIAQLINNFKNQKK